MNQTANEYENCIIDLIENQIRPSIQNHGGNIEYVGYNNGNVTVRLTGQCARCPSANLSTRYYIKDVLSSALPYVREVTLDEKVDDELLAQARAILFGNRQDRS
ncbi:MAG: NifU family protein [Eubacterium sp.]|nr:NifU family protein [Eubacterium sp.]